MILQPIAQKLQADIEGLSVYYGDYVPPTEGSTKLPACYLANAEINAEFDDTIGKLTRQQVTVNVRITSIGAQTPYVTTFDALEPYADLHAQVIDSLLGFRFEYRGEQIFQELQYVLGEPIQSDDLFVAYADTFQYVYIHEKG